MNVLIVLFTQHFSFKFEYYFVDIDITIMFSCAHMIIFVYFRVHVGVLACAEHEDKNFRKASQDARKENRTLSTCQV